MALALGGGTWWEPLRIGMLASFAYLAVVWRLGAWRDVLTPRWQADAVRATGWPERPVTFVTNVVWAFALGSVVVSWLR